MNLKSLILLLGSTSLTCATGAFAQVAPAQPAAQTGGPQATGTQPDAGTGGPAAGNQAAAATNGPTGGEIVVTGSRVVSNGNKAPTPVTIVTAQRLLTNTPTNIPDALRALPQFAGSTGQRNGGLAGTNGSGNTLNLRNFGPQRLLVLLDGNRVQPTANNGSVNVDTMPEMLLQRVDIVTGGASAVYGSDAVSGVVNYVLDHNFNGIKTVSQFGVSKYGDDKSYKLGIAAGTKIFGDRGHIEVSYEKYHSAGLPSVFDRALGLDNPIASGAGTAADPIGLYQNGRYLTTVRGSYIVSGPAAVVGDVFLTNGIATKFVHGLPTGTVGTESGGDGGWVNNGAILDPLTTDKYFGRFDYELTPSISAYAMINYDTSYTRYNAIGNFILSNFGTILSGNPFIPANIQQAMTAAGGQSISINRMEDIRDGYKPEQTEGIVKSLFVSTGLKGDLGSKFHWNVQYNHGRTSQRVNNIGNIDAEKLSAALDVVTGPNGSPVCYISTTQYASRFPGCLPLNIFGPTAPSQAAYDFVRTTTSFNLVNTLDDYSATISGSPFELPAGPVNVSLNGEYRHVTLTNDSSVDPTRPLDCDGLRANCQGGGITPYTQAVTTSMHAAENVGEVAGEILVPLLKDIPFVKSLDLNGAGRYTHYSASGTAWTWKAGLTWAVTSDLRLRATRSRDIRAPNLFDLYNPTSIAPSGMNDLHTGVVGAPFVYSQGNPNLKPEVANTVTAGFVYQPSWFPNFSLSVDYYDIKIANAITTVSGTDQAVQQVCEQSGGTSPYCALYVRPHPFSDHSADNFPTQVFAEGLNAAKQWTRGVDVEVNYNTELANIFAKVPGSLAIRSLVSYQPVSNVQTISTAPINHFAGIGGISKWRLNVNAAYTLGNLLVSVQERWQSSNHPYDPATTVYTVPEFKAKSYTDLTIQYNVKVAGHELQPFFNVQNVFNTQPPVAGSFSYSPGLVYAAAPGYDVIGRYFTVGLKTKF